MALAPRYGQNSTAVKPNRKLMATYGLNGLSHATGPYSHSFVQLNSSRFVPDPTLSRPNMKYISQVLNVSGKVTIRRPCLASSTICAPSRMTAWSSAAKRLPSSTPGLATRSRLSST